MMTDNNHPITPPDELVKQWIQRYGNSEDPRWQAYEQDIATQAARWGADQELDAICKWLVDNHWFMKDGPCVRELRAARRPKPPSLKEQALTELNLTADPEGAELSQTQVELIRRALESLPD